MTIKLHYKQINMQASQTTQRIVSDVRKNVGNFRELNQNNFLIERMAGRTNQTYKVSLKDSKTPPVIYRKFGQSESNLFLDRQTQRIIYQHVSEQKLGPKIHCYIGDLIRIQEFIESRTLQNKQTLETEAIQNVAFTLRKFHHMQEPDQIQSKSLFSSVFFEKEEQLLRLCKDKMNQNIYDQKQQESLNLLKNWVTPQEIEFVKKAVEPLQKQPLIFSHNDLLANNIIIENSNNKYIFIDYEYSTYNYPIYDIANYFNEYEINYNVRDENGFLRNQVPENIEELRRKFIECYCLAGDKSYDQYKDTLNNDDEKNKVQEQVQNLVSQFHLGVMLSNLMWGWWAIKVCKNPSINFDYIEYAKTKYQNYLKIKNSGKWKVNQL